MLSDDLRKQRDKLVADPKLVHISLDERQKSAYNLVYGMTLALFLCRKGLVEIQPKKGNKSKKIEQVLQSLQTQVPDLFVIDLPNYSPDDLTLGFSSEIMIDVVSNLNKLDYSLDYQSFWLEMEAFFISSF